jgi:outer membrane protein OmpA-like peptidoglycan-associated protein/tetratricopeptide (TPR) repeat protein
MRITEKKYLLLWWLCSPLLCFLPSAAAQQAVEWYKKGETLLIQGKIEQALHAFRKAGQAQQDFLAARRHVGLCLELLKDYDKALDEYKYVLSQDSLFSRGLYFQVGELCYKTGHYLLAAAYFERFQELQKMPAAMFGLRGERELMEEAEYLLRVPAAIRASQIAMDSIKLVNITEVRSIGPMINSRADEYFPSLSNDRQLLFYTRRANKSADEDLYFSKKTQSEWQPGSEVGGRFNSVYHEGMPALVRDGRKLYFTACGRSGVMGPCDLWEADIDPQHGEISQSRPLQGVLNSERWESQAAVSCDGNKLFFASNRPGGFGGTDLWMSQRQPDGSWGEPINLGNRINTPADEEAPFLTNDGNTLYFSSTGHPGLGEQDIFVSWKDTDGHWTSPVNIGPPVNTAFRELGFFLTADGLTGYFASDRPGGFGGMDIYTFELSDQLHSEPITFVEGFVRDSVLGIPLQVTLEIDEVGSVKTDSEGRFFKCVKAGTVMDISTSRKFYHSYTRQFPIPKWDNVNLFPIEILLRSDALPLGAKPDADPASTAQTVPSRPGTKHKMEYSVFFEFDQSNLSGEEVESMRNFIRKVQSKNVVHVEVIGYADDIGSDVYNLKLSEQRAKKVAVLLVQQEISIDQISIEGKGEISGEKTKEKSRRVDIRVSYLED